MKIGCLHIEKINTAVQAHFQISSSSRFQIRMQGEHYQFQENKECQVMVVGPNHLNEQLRFSFSFIFFPLVVDITGREQMALSLSKRCCLTTQCIITHSDFYKETKRCNFKIIINKRSTYASENVH